MLDPIYKSCHRCNISDRNEVAALFKDYYPQSLDVYSYHLKNISSELSNQSQKGQTIKDSLLGWKNIIKHSTVDGPSFVMNIIQIPNITMYFLFNSVLILKFSY